MMKVLEMNHRVFELIKIKPLSEIVYYKEDFQQVEIDDESELKKEVMDFINQYELRYNFSEGIDHDDLFDRTSSGRSCYELLSDNVVIFENHVYGYLFSSSEELYFVTLTKKYSVWNEDGPRFSEFTYTLEKK